MLSCLVALGIFWYKEAGKLMDGFTRILGLLMIVLTVYIAIVSAPPVAEALYRTVWPEKIDVMKIVTLVGGTVGGYISFAGAHRLLDAGISGHQNIKRVTVSSVTGIIITSIMRYVLFLAALGVVWQGVNLAASNPAASVFSSAAGELGYKFFGIVLWSAAITSVVGASYTSVSFWKTLSPLVKRNEKLFISGFIILSTIIFISWGNPVKLLVLAGAVNGLILPLALSIILLAATRSSIIGLYKHPLLLQIIGWIVVLVMLAMGYITIRDSFGRLFS
jgi:Mn2+/Fe2+ NRAMP family transporter